MISRKKWLLGREQFRRWEWTLISCFLQFKSLLLFLSPAKMLISKPPVEECIFFVACFLVFSACSAPPWGVLGHLLRRDADLLSEPQPKGRATMAAWRCLFCSVNPAVGLVGATTQRVQWGIYLEWMMSEDSQVAWPGAKIQPPTVLPFLPFHHPHGSPIETDSLSTSANALTQTNNSRVE